MPKLSRAEAGILVFKLVYLAIGLIASLQGDNAGFVVYVVVLSLLMGVGPMRKNSGVAFACSANVRWMYSAYA